MPPLKKSTVVYGRPSSRTPDWATAHSGEPAAAVTRSGITWCSAPRIEDRHVVAGLRAAHHRGRELRVEQAALRRLHLHRPVHALVVGQARQQRAAHRVGGHGVGVGHHAVDGARLGGRGAGEVGHDLVALHRERDAEAVGRLEAVGLDAVAVGAVGHRADSRRASRARSGRRARRPGPRASRARTPPGAAAPGSPSARWRSPAPRCRPPSGRGCARWPAAGRAASRPPAPRGSGAVSGMWKPSSNSSRRLDGPDAAADVRHV